MIHGETKIELIDVKTGEVETFIDHNMMTNALREVFNKCPYGLNNLLIQSATESTATRLTPTNLRALGGLLLFPETIAEDANTIYADASNKPTGIASNDAYSGEDTRRGSFNSVESAVLPNGFRYVWDFTTSQANGTIACACLTSAKGGAGYLDAGNPFAHDPSYTSRGNIIGININELSGLSASVKRTTFYAGSDGVYILRSDGKTVDRFTAPNTNLPLLDSYKYETLFVADTVGYACADEDAVYFVRPTAGSSATAKTVAVDRYERGTWSKTTSTFSVAAPLKAVQTGGTIAKNGKYLYLISYDNTKLFKVDTTNPADITTIDVGTVELNNSMFGDMVASPSYLVESDGTVHRNTTGMYPAGRVGAWGVFGRISPTNNAYYMFGISPYMPYLASINNLDQSVVKTSDKAMKVTYTVTYS